MTSGTLRLSNSQHAIVIDNIIAFKFHKRHDKHDFTVFTKGTIVGIVEHSQEILVRLSQTEKASCITDIFKITKGDGAKLIPIESWLFPYLLAVSSTYNRIIICKNQSEYKQVIKCEKDSKVYLLPENGQQGDPEPCTLRYKGPVPELGKGCYFGLDLWHTPKSNSSNDGSIGGKSYFNSITNCGVFVSLDRVKFYTHFNESTLKISTSMPANNERKSQLPSSGGNGSPEQTKFKTTLVLSLKNKNSNNSMSSYNHPQRQPQGHSRAEALIDFNSYDLNVGDRVVWMSPFTGPELGSVREIKGNRAVVEFDQPIEHPPFDYLQDLYKHKTKAKTLCLPLEKIVKADEFFDGSNKSSPVSKEINPSFENGNVTKNGKNINNTLNRGDNSKMQHQVQDEIDNLDYKFHEPLIDSHTTKSRRSKKTSTNITLDSYPIGEAKPRDYLTNSDYQSNKYNSGTVTTNRSSEAQIRHSYSQELHQTKTTRHSHDLFGLEDKLEKLNSSNGFIKPTRYLRKEIDDSFMFLSLSDSESNGTLPPNFSSSSNYLSDRYSYLLDDPDLTSTSTHHTDLDVGSLVQVNIQGEPRYGVIRWIGFLSDDVKKNLIAGIEMEEEDNTYSDGIFHGHRYFQCTPKKALFVNAKNCHKDSRFQDNLTPIVETKSHALGQMDSQVIPGAIPPITFKDDICGKVRGIQGHHNSCYLDATLFSMFSFTSVFDSLLFRPPTSRDNAQYKEVQRVLREEIVNPLRKNYYVGACNVMKLRHLLEKFSSVTGLTSEEKDPEEFLTSLVAQILRAEPFLKLSSGQEAYHYQLFVEKDEELTFPSVQQLFEQSFLTSDIKLKEVPSCLIIQMPRFGKSYKMYPRILPSQLLDVTDVIEDSPRQCIVCGKLAEYECKECFGQCNNYGLESISFCGNCLETAHSHQRRSNHKFRRLSVPVEFMILQEHCPIPRLYMELFAVVCIETSHYVAFVKCGSGSEAPWVFFDSMADRKGEQNGYNIPEIVLCKNLPYWLSDEGANSLNEMQDRQLPEHAKRLLCDAYMCMYQSPDVMMYR